MRNLIPLVCLCSAAAFISGCANDVESPFAMSKKEIRESVVVELSADNQFKVNGAAVNYSKFPEALQKLGRETPGKKVSLLTADGSEPAAIPYVEKMSARAGLGPVTVVSPEKPKAPEAAPAPVPAPAKPTAVAAETKPAPAVVAQPWETAPVAAPVVAAAPVEKKLNLNVVRIDVSATTEFKVNGNPVSHEDLPGALKELGAEFPGRKVEIYAVPGANLRAVPYIYQASKDAGLGPVEAK